MSEAKRNPVDFRYDCVNPTFLKWLARLGGYGAQKYGESQYTLSRLTGEKAPINHIYEHLRQFQEGEAYDHFDGDARWHLVAIAFNAMMEFFYTTKFGHVKNPLKVAVELQRPDQSSPKYYRSVAVY